MDNIHKEHKKGKPFNLILFNVEELKYEYKIPGDIGFKKNQYAIVNVGKTATYLIAPPFCCKVSAKTDSPRYQANILTFGVETKCRFRCKKIRENVVQIIEEHLPGCQKIMPMTNILGDLNLNIKGTIQLLGQKILNTHKVLKEIGRRGLRQSVFFVLSRKLMEICMQLKA